MSRFAVIAGLGNPGREYERTRHNIGFLVADALYDGVGGDGSGSLLVQRAWHEKSDAMLAQVRFGGDPVWLIKPQSYMNLSGEPLQKFMRFYKYSVDQLVVVHDEIDLPFGTLRLKQGGGDGGHNGLRSIASALGSKDFFRLRVGVGRPKGASNPSQEGDDAGRAGKIRSVSSWVLGGFSDADENELPELLERACGALRVLRTDGLKKAQNRFNG